MYQCPDTKLTLRNRPPNKSVESAMEGAQRSAQIRGEDAPSKPLAIGILELKEKEGGGKRGGGGGRKEERRRERREVRRRSRRRRRITCRGWHTPVTPAADTGASRVQGLPGQPGARFSPNKTKPTNRTGVQLGGRTPARRVRGAGSSLSTAHTRSHRGAVFSPRLNTYAYSYCND